MSTENLKTPFYRVKEKDLLYDINLLKEALTKNWGNFVMGYSVKTNSLPWLLSYLKDHGFYAEVVSEMEYDIAKRIGYTDDRIVYNSPIKDRKVWEQVLLGGGYVNLDSSYELNWIEEICGQYPDKIFKVGLRVNCDIAALCPEEQLVEEEGGRFGYCYENGKLKEAIDKVQSITNAKVAGLHLHSSTQSRTVKVYGALAKMAVNIAKEYALDLEFVDMGGGYFGGRDDKPNYLNYFEEIGKELREYFKPEKTKIIAEPGVSLISRAMSFETTVLDIKDIRNRKFIVTDGSRVNLNPLVTRHVYPHHVVYSSDTVDRPIEKTQWICGSTCMEYDRLFEIVDDVALIPGDKIVYDTAGGYTMCLNPLFIHYFPAIWIEKMDGSLYQAREPWTNDEYMQKYHWKGWTN